MSMPNCSRSLAIILLLGCGALGGTAPARADTNRTCTGFIDSLPATISTPGVWCLRRDLATAITAGDAITLAANGVVLDCNDFKLGGLAAGPTSRATGIGTAQRRDITVRRCGVRGFFMGINLDNGSGQLVEDNRLDGNLFAGIRVTGEQNTLRRNRIYRTGGATAVVFAYGIFAGDADVVDNVVSGVFSTSPDASITGITVLGSRVSRNRVRGLVVNGDGEANGIAANVPGRIEDNQVVSSEWLNGYGIAATLGGGSQCRGNTVGGYATAIRYCTDIGGNATF